MEWIKDVENAPKPVGAYSPAVVIGETVYCAGQIGINPQTGKLVEGGIEPECKQVLENIKAVLESSGSSFKRVALTTVFLADIKDAPTVNGIYAQYVDPVNPPARQMLAVKDLPLGCRVEISVIASRGA